jgi:hypothetical protein
MISHQPGSIIKARPYVGTGELRVFFQNILGGIAGADKPNF